MNLRENAHKWSRRTLVFQLWRSYCHWRFRTRVLPKMEFTELHGVRLDLRDISFQMKKALTAGKYEEAEILLCGQVLAPEDKVIEIGSAIGFLGLFAVKRLGLSPFFSVEANPATARILTGNYALNGVNPSLLVAALADHDQPVQLTVTEDFWANSISTNLRETPGETVTVSGYRLESIFAKAPFPPNTLIVDVEGAETCLQSETIPQSVKKLIIEMHPAIIGTTKTFEILKHLLNQGFEVKATFDTSYALIRA